MVADSAPVQCYITNAELEMRGIPMERGETGELHPVTEIAGTL